MSVDFAYLGGVGGGQAAAVHGEVLAEQKHSPPVNRGLACHNPISNRLVLLLQVKKKEREGDG